MTIISGSSSNKLCLVYVNQRTKWLFSAIKWKLQVNISKSKVMRFARNEDASAICANLSLQFLEAVVF